MQLSRRDAATVESGALQFYATTRFECLATTLDTLSLSLFPLAFCLSPVHHPLNSPSSLSLSPCCTPNPSRASCPCPQKPSPGDRYYCYRYRSNRARSGFSSHTSHSRYRCGQLLLTTTATVLRRYIAIAKTPTETQYASNRTRYSGFSLRPFLRVRGLSPFFPIFLFSYLLCLSRFVFLCFGRGIRPFYYG